MGKALRSVRRQRSEGKIWISAFIIVVVRIVRNVPYWAESETQMLGFVVEEFVVIYTYTYVLINNPLINDLTIKNAV